VQPLLQWKSYSVLRIMCVCVYVALGIQYAMRMRRTILSLVACPALQNVSTLSHKQHDFRGWGGGGCNWT